MPFTHRPVLPTFTVVEDRRETWAVGGVLLGTMLQSIDGSIVNVAVPQIQKALSAPLTDVSWAVTSYVLASLVSMPLAAPLARRMGTRTFFSASVLLFTLSSAACGLAPSAWWLIGFRVLQGLGAGGLLPLAQGILMALHTGARRARAIALIGFATVLGPLLGPPIGGVLTEAFGWSSIFFINVPLGLLSLHLLRGLRVPGEARTGQERPLDVRGGALLALTVGGLQLACAHALWALGPAALAFVLLLREERSAADPVIDLGVLRHRKLAGTLLAVPLYGIGLYGSVFATPLLLEHQLGMGAARAGLVLAIGGGTSAVAILSSKQLLARFGARSLCNVGAFCFAASMLWLAWVARGGADEVLWAQALRGAWTGMLYFVMNGFAFDAVPPEELVAASGFFYVLRQLGGSLGVALCALAMAGVGTRGTVGAFLALAATAPLALVPMALADARRGRGRRAATAAPAA